MPAFNQRWETYKVTGIKFSGFNLFSRAMARSISQQMTDYVQSVTGEEDETLDLVSLVPESRRSSGQGKVHPDLIVQFGDGLAYFGGRGKKVIHEDIENGFSREERTFLWQMT